MRVLWKVDDLDPRRASVRYRAHYPAGWLADSGHETKVVEWAAADDLDEVDVLVVSKAFRPADAELAHAAAARGVRVVLDICDNIFAPEYGGAAGLIMAGVFQAMSRLASAIVVPGPALAEALAPLVPPSVPLVVIADPIETSAEIGALLGRLEGAGFVAFLRRLHRAGSSQRRLAHKTVFAAKTIAMRGPRDPAWLLNGIRRRLRPRGPGPRSASPQGPTAPKKTAIWFGNSGNDYAEFGMRTLLLIAPALIRIARETPFRLLVVSDDAGRYRQEIAPLPLATEYRAWHPLRIFDDIRSADVALLPNSLDPFSRCKSANRAALALSLGVPVVATDTPALAPLADCIRVDDWEDGLRTYLGNSDIAARDVAVAAPLIERHFGREAILREWDGLLRRVASSSSSPVEPVRLLFFLDLVQDLDVVLPVIDAALADGRFEPAVWATGSLAGRSPRVVASLARRGIMPRLVGGDDWDDALRRALGKHEALVTGSESTARPHRRAHVLTRAARALGLATFTLQHGVEAIGLTWFDAVHDETVTFASEHVLLWGPLETLSPRVPAETRAKCLPVGRAVPSPTPPPPAAAGCVAVFENLHWHRYDDAFREAFLADLARLAEEFPERRFLVKPHHAGRWLALAEASDLHRFANVAIADPADPAWEPYTAPAIIAAAAAAVTTPSTVALDAVIGGKAVAVAGYGLELPIYEPLPILRSYADWREFVASIGVDTTCAEVGRSFVARRTIPGAAAPRILAILWERVRSQAPAQSTNAARPA